MADATSSTVSYPSGAVATPVSTGLVGGAISSTYGVAADPTPANQHQIILGYAYPYLTVVPDSILFTWNGLTFYDREGVMYHSMDPATGAGTVAGKVGYTTKVVTLTDYGPGDASHPLGTASTARPVVLSLLLQDGSRAVSFARFRTPGAPLRPGSFIVRATTLDGTLLTGISDTTGKISGTDVGGYVDFQNGIVEVNFGTEYADSGPGPFPYRGAAWYSTNAQFTKNGGPYVIQPRPVDPSSIVFNTVVYTAIPLDADLIGIDPVRLPTDGRVPIFKTGYVIVVHDTQYTSAPNNLISGQVITLTRANQTYIYVRDQNGLVVPSDRYAVNLTAGTITISNPVNLAGFVQPLVIEDRIEDMLLCTDVDISGVLRVARALRHAYDPATALVSSALLFGDLQARYTGLFDQQTWANVYSDTLVGNAAPASYNDVDYPIDMTDEGAITQRWAIVFTAPTTFNVIGEDVGLIVTGSTGATLAPDNPHSVNPYFTLHKEGWGTGWSAGNVLRFNTIGALAPIWFARTTRPGDETTPTDNFRIQIRGDAE